MKKVLSFVLVLAMILGCTSMAFATVFKDQAQVTNTEAVAVLNAVGVLEGDDAGNMRPTATLTRAEACAIIARLMLGTEAAKKLTATVAPFADVAADNWAAGYIAYCASEGIVAGVGNNNFNPTGTLKVGEFGKMLLCVLGYDAKAEGLTGSDWANNTAKLMVAAGITVTESNNDDCAREVAAQLALNALEATCVEYATAGTSVTVGNTTINVGGSKASAVAAVESSNTEYYDYTVNNGEYLIASAPAATLELAEKLFPGTLFKSNTATTDKYGRDAVQWTYKTTTKLINMGPFTSKKPVMTATTAIKAADLYNRLGADAVITGAASRITYAGTSASAFIYDNAVTSAAVSVSAIKENDKTIGGNGIITEIYKVTGDTYKVVQIKPELLQVTSVAKTVASALHGAKTTYKLSNNISLVEYTSVVDEETDVNNFVADCTLAKDDYVMVYGPEKDYVVKATTKVTGLLTGKTSTNTVTLDGTKYAASAASGSAMAAATLSSKKNNTIVLDSYGYAVKALDSESTYIYVFGAGTKQFLDSTTNVVDSATVIYASLTDGTFVEAKATHPGIDNVAGLYKYTVDAKGVYTLTNAGITTVAATTFNAMSLVANGVYANNSTKYFVAQYDSVNNKYTGIVEYTGYANMPKSTQVSGNAVIVTDTALPNTAKYVFVDYQVLSSKLTSYVYFTGSYAVEGTDYIYDVVVKGEETTLVLDKSILTTAGLRNVEASGSAAELKATNVSITGGNDGILTEAGFVSYADGLIKITTASSLEGTPTWTVQCEIGDDVPVYSFEKHVCTVMTAADLYQASYTTLVLDVNTAKTAVQAIYLVK